MSKVKIFLVRLAQTEANVRHVLSNNSCLSAVGKTQAIKIRDRLKTESFDAMISSSISASIETAKIISGPHRLSVRPHNGFNEVDWGDWEGLSKSEIAAKWPHLWNAFLNGELSAAPSGELLSNVKTRLLESLNKISRDYPAGSICITGHGAANRILTVSLLNAPVASFPRLPNTNTSLTVFDYSPDYGARFELIADDRHLHDSFDGLVVKHTLSQQGLGS